MVVSQISCQIKSPWCHVPSMIFLIFSVNLETDNYQGELLKYYRNRGFVVG